MPPTRRRITKRSQGHFQPKNWIEEGDGLIASSRHLHAKWKTYREEFSETVKERKAGFRDAKADWALLTGLPKASMLLLGYAVEMYLKAGLSKAYFGCAESMFTRDIKQRFRHQYKLIMEGCKMRNVKHAVKIAVCAYLLIVGLCVGYSVEAQEVAVGLQCKSKTWATLDLETMDIIRHDEPLDLSYTIENGRVWTHNNRLFEPEDRVKNENGLSTWQTDKNKMTLNRLTGTLTLEIYSVERVIVVFGTCKPREALF